MYQLCNIKGRKSEEKSTTVGQNLYYDGGAEHQLLFKFHLLVGWRVHSERRHLLEHGVQLALRRLLLLLPGAAGTEVLLQDLQPDRTLRRSHSSGHPWRLEKKIWFRKSSSFGKGNRCELAFFKGLKKTFFITHSHPNFTQINFDFFSFAGYAGHADDLLLLFDVPIPILLCDLYEFFGGLADMFASCISEEDVEQCIVDPEGQFLWEFIWTYPVIFLEFEPFRRFFALLTKIYFFPFRTEFGECLDGHLLDRELVTSDAMVRTFTNFAVNGYKYVNLQMFKTRTRFFQQSNCWDRVGFESLERGRPAVHRLQRRHLRRLRIREDLSGNAQGLMRKFENSNIWKFKYSKIWKKKV